MYFETTVCYCGGAINSAELCMSINNAFDNECLLFLVPLK